MARGIISLKNLKAFGLSTTTFANLKTILVGLRENPFIREIVISDRKFQTDEALQREVDSICRRNCQLIEQMDELITLADKLMAIQLRMQELILTEPRQLQRTINEECIKTHSKIEALLNPESHREVPSSIFSR